jgi:WD40 repeat protein/energy-coupling factor transporter ATP-binding protein EcfA2
MRAANAALAMPYPGLRPFEAEDQPLFFGREAQVSAMLVQLEDHRFVAVVGSSGSGKSSLVRAGLLPAVREGFLLGTTDWLTIIIKPGHQPYQRLVRALHRATRSAEASVAVPTADDPLTPEETATLATLRRTDRGLLTALNELAISSESRVMVVVDQFEELFAFRRAGVNRDTVTSRDEAAAFVGMLLRSASDPAGRVWAILTMRSDFIGDCEAFLGLPEQISRSQFLVPRLDRGQMEEAIARPASVEEGAFKTFTFKDGLVNRIINEAGDRPDQLPLMQHALMRTWKRATVRAGVNGSVKVTPEDYEQAGGIEKALSLHADAAWDEIKDGPKKAHLARRLFLLLCDISPDGQITRRRPKVDEVQAVTGASVPEIEQVIRVFQQDDRNFLLPPPAQHLTAESYLDISHEALLRQWRLFAGEWQEQERRDASELRRLAELASLRKQGQGVGLLPARDLERIARWKQRVSPEWAHRYVTQNEWADTLAFVEDSQAEMKREEEVRRNEARRKRAWVVAVALVLAVATLVSLSAAIFSFLQMTRARQAEQAGKEQLFLSLLTSARAGRFSGQLGQRFDSLDALAKAARIHVDEQLRNEATVAMALPDFRPGPSWDQDGITAVDESYKFSAKADAGGLITVRSVPDGREVGRIESGSKSNGMLFSKDGRFLAQYCTNPNNTWRVWRWADKHSVLGAPVPGAWCVAFSPDSHQIAIGQKNHILLFDLDTGEKLRGLEAHGVVHALAFSPDNRWLAVGYDGAEITSIYNAANGDNLADLPVGPTGNQVVAWHPDGVRLAIGSSDPRIQIWNVETKFKVATLDGHVQLVTNLSFHPGGELLASYGWEGVCRIWNPSSGRQLLQTSSFRPIYFSTDGRWFGTIRSGNKDRLLEAASTPEYRTIVSSRGTGKGDYYVGAMSPDGRLFAFGMEDGVRIWDPSTWRELAFLPVKETRSVIFQPDGHEMLTCGPGGGLLRWPIQGSPDTSNKIRLGPPKAIALDSTPTRASLSQDGRTLAVVCEPRGSYLVDLTTGSVKSPLLAHQQAGWVALSPDGRWMASSGWHSDGATLWDTANGKVVKELGLGQMTNVAFTPDSRKLVTCRAEELRFWDLASPDQSRPVPAEPGGAWRDIAFSPDGKLMAMALAPTVVQLCEIASGRMVARIEDPHGDRVTWMGFNADGTHLLTSSEYTKVIHDWDLRTIRTRLKAMGLDWDWPEFPPSSELRPLPGNPIRKIDVISGD